MQQAEDQAAGKGRPLDGLAPALRRLFSLWVVWFLAAVPPAAGSRPVPPEMLQDAELADVFFVDPDRGWAVGDRGVIWSTDDGGRWWYLQRSGVSCRLNSVYFLDDEHGWAVGGRTHPYTHRSTGVVLRTQDGGRRWEELHGVGLPLLRRVKFFDAQHGCAIGESSPLYPSGVLHTEDGGRSWAGAPTGASHLWLTGDLQDRGRGAAAGYGGQVARLDLPTIRPARAPPLGLAHPRRLRLDGHSGGWLVGDGGLVWRTSDGGQTWRAPPTSLPPGCAQHFDFQALAVQRPHCWIAGSPGTCVFYSPDEGRTWQRLPTGQSLPIRSLAFFDQHHGWAVGALGTILATRDGGRTWRRQRGAARRAALLGVFSQPDRIPLELLARLSGNEGYLAAVVLLNRRDVEVPTREQWSAARRAHEAAVLVGAASAETARRFPLRQPGLPMSVAAMLDGWDQASGGRGAARLEEYVVGKIRQWRPDLVVTETVDSDADQPLAYLTGQLVFRAVEKAADPRAYPQQLQVAGLTPWKVKKLFSRASQRQSAAVQLVTTQLAHRLGRSLADVAAEARALVADRPQSVPTMIGFRLLASDLPPSLAGKDFFSGIALQPGGVARRRLGPPPPARLEGLRRMVQKRRNIEQLLARKDADPHRGSSWLAQVADLTRGLSSDGAAQVLYELGWRYEQAGQPQLAAEAFEYLVAHYATHDLAEAALVWLLPYYASGEAAWRLRHQSGFYRSVTTRDHADPVQRLAAEPAAGGEQRAAFPSVPPPEVPPSVQLASHEGRLEQPFWEAHRAARAAELGSLIERTRPGLFAAPQIRFPLAAVKRTQGALRDALRLYNGMARAVLEDSWALCARTELWLNKPSKIAPKPVYHCLQAKTKPRLDGQLREEVWQRASAAELQSALHDDAGWPAAVMLSHDEEFLYLAVRCRKAAGADYEFAAGPRPRDPDLSGRDRVDLLFDLDRDYTTFYRFTVDYRGWTGEACLGDTAWDPQWFVASARTKTTWTVEAAIPLRELAGKPPSARNPWAVGMQRTIPKVGFQSWTQPAAVQPRPEGFGLLIFD